MKFMLGLMLIITWTLHCAEENTNEKYLVECLKKQSIQSKNKYILLNFEARIKLPGHLFKPWQVMEYTNKGNVWLDSDNFLKNDTLISFSGREYYAKIVHNNNTLLEKRYSRENLSSITNKAFQNQVLNNIDYNPMNILTKFYDEKEAGLIYTDDGDLVCEMRINQYQIKLYIDKTDTLLKTITILNYDDLHGDVLTTYLYSDFKNIGGVTYPSSIKIAKINGKIEDEVKILSAKIVDELPDLLEKPANYSFSEDEAEKKKEIAVSRFSDNIYFVELKHADEQVMIVEFEKFLAVAEAPLSSENGELIIAEAKKIAPDKPIKYFMFSHHHPHYLGGMRPFIHRGATVLCTEENKDYVKYLASARHSLQPDNLEMDPKVLNTEIIEDSKTISDGKFKMVVYHLGEKSAHTNDFIYYYFPKEKMLFEGDLVWIPKEGEIKKASDRQAGLYNDIIARGLEVDTVIQSWAPASSNVKLFIPFDDIKKSMEIVE